VSGTVPPGRTGFADHFSRDSASYAAFRPRYPAELFTFIAGLPASRGLAWDVGTGSGQAASMLAGHFDRVAASDASVAQLRVRARVQGVHYLAERGEASAIAGGRVDLVTVAQAYHWLDHRAFHVEVDRVIAPGGALAVWCYGKHDPVPELGRVLASLWGNPDTPKRMVWPVSVRAGRWLGARER
jgi:SAM-dependent methyltransferase